MRIRGGAQIGDKFRERVGEIFVVAEAEAVAFHDHLAAEAGVVGVESDHRVAFRGRQNRRSDGVAAGGEGFVSGGPVERCDALLNGKHTKV